MGFPIRVLGVAPIREHPYECNAPRLNHRPFGFFGCDVLRIQSKGATSEIKPSLVLFQAAEILEPSEY